MTSEPVPSALKPNFDGATPMPWTLRAALQRCNSAAVALAGCIAK
jgi:hypothetical protein